MLDTWYECELSLLRELREKLKLDVDTMRDLISELNSMARAIENDCSVIEMVILQCRRDRAMKRYLREYNDKFGRDANHKPPEPEGGYDVVG
jgi:hypothetical protein